MTDRFPHGHREAWANRRRYETDVRSVNGDGPACECGAASTLHLRPSGTRQGRFFCHRCVLHGLWPDRLEQVA